MSKEDDLKMEEIETAFTAVLVSQETALITYITVNIEGPKSTERVVNSAFNVTGAKKEINDGIVESAVNGVNVGRQGTALGQELIEDKDAVTEFVIRTTYGRNKPQLFKTLENPEYTQVVIDEINEQFKLNATWIERAKAIQNSADIVGDIPKGLRELNRLAQKSSLTLTEQREYKRLLNATQRQINRLATDNASQGRLKKAYQKVINATREANREALERSIERAIKEKMRYNAERISRTESFYAYGQNIQGTAVANELIGGLKFNLDPFHKIFDICDSYAKADLYGLGKGVYPTEFAPLLPIHPNGQSTLDFVSVDALDGKKGRYTNQGMENYISSLSKKQQQKLLTIDGQKQFEENPESWKKNLRQWEKPPRFVKRTPK